jgi:hypothetical protein
MSEAPIIKDVRNYPRYGAVHQIQFTPGDSSQDQHRLITIMGEDSVEGDWENIHRPAKIETKDGQHLMVVDDDLVPYNPDGIDKGIEVVPIKVTPEPPKEIPIDIPSSPDMDI